MLLGHNAYRQIGEGLDLAEPSKDRMRRGAMTGEVKVMTWKTMVVAAMGLVLGLGLVLSTGTGAYAAEQDTACPICDFDMTGYTGDLNEAEIGGLLLALNDEYHAWAVYDQVISDHGDVRPFTNIRDAETTHAAALIRLFDAHDVPVPDNPWPGNVPSFDSVTDACAAGAEAEIANVDVYSQVNGTTERDDILVVYNALQTASQEKHLPAFQRCSEGVTPGAGVGPGGNQGRRGQGPGNGQGVGPGNGQGNRGSGSGAIQPGQGNGICEPGTGKGNGQGRGQQGTGPGNGQPGQGNGPGNGTCEPGTGLGAGQVQPGAGRAIQLP
jgi:hypothetical protein